MDDNAQKAEEVLNTNSDNTDFFDDDINIENAITDATKIAQRQKRQEQKAVKQRASKKRKEANKIKKNIGIRASKQSKFPTRSHTFLSKPISDRAVHIVMNHQRTEIYKDGADICPRILMGIPAYGKPCVKNAFEHLITVQEKIKTARGENPKKAPRWIILSNDTSMIMDRNLLTRLDELRPVTVAAGAYGFQRIRASGKWYQIDNASEQQYLKGCYIQGNLENLSWDFIVGNRFKESPRYRVLIVHGPFIALRGELFMDMDFREMAENVKTGFFHYMADISMECHKRNHYIAQVKTVSSQFENINTIRDDENFQHDQSFFASKWQSKLPASITDFNLGA